MEDEYTCAACRAVVGSDADRCPSCGEPVERVRESGGTPTSARESATSLSPLVAAGSPPEKGSGSHRSTGLTLARAARFGTLAIVAVALVLGLSQFGGTESRTVGGNETTDTSSPVPGIEDEGWAEEWDPDIRPLATFVESRRGLPFRAPVEVEFLSPDDFQATLEEKREELSAQDREALRAETGVLRALGLFAGDFDILTHLEDPSLAVLGYFDHDDKTIRISSEELDLFTEVTVVHELAHALQDQYFDLSRLEEFEHDDGFAGFKSLVEGDATRIEFEYLETLNAEEFSRWFDETNAYFEELLAENETAEGEDPPAVYGTFAMAPYVLGDVFAQLLVAVDGEEAIDAAFKDPPAGEMHILDPWTYLDGDQRKQLDVPGLRDGEEAVESGELGALTWYLVLAERIDAGQALRAFDGFAGDSFATFRRGGTVCIRAHFQGRTNADNGEMYEALTAWQAEMPDGAVDVERRPTLTAFESCDPGPDNVSYTGRGTEALFLPAGRVGLALGALELGATDSEARCFGTAMIDAVSLDELVAYVLAAPGAGSPPAAVDDAALDCFGRDGPGGD